LYLKVLNTYIKDSFQIFQFTLLFYELDVGFYNLAMEGRFLLIPVDLSTLQLLLKCLSGFTIFTLYLNFIYFDTKCGSQFLHYSVFIYLYLLSIRYFIFFKKTSFVSRIQCSISATHNSTHLQKQRKRHNHSCFYTTDVASADLLKNT